MSTPLFGKLFAQPVAIDPGTASTRIYTHDRGVVLNQPSVVCFRKAGGAASRSTLAAVGELAKALLGREPAHIEAVRPMQHGVIADAHAAGQMIRRFIDMSDTRSRFGRRIEVTLCVPSDATAVERRALREAAFAAGVSEVALIDEALAAALGAGLPVTEPVGSMVVDIGGGTTEVAVISLGGIVYREAIRVGGDQFDEAIVNHVRSLHGVLLGEQTAEHVKKTIGSATRAVPRRTAPAVGRGVEDGLPRAIELSNHDVADALAAPLKQVIGTVKSVLENAPAELVTDIAHRGIVLTGGGALLADLERLLRDETGLDARIAEDPATCAVRGAGEARGRLAVRALG
ncbi:rod shape-determining protein [Burkholderia multivorans]|uniref:Cell shape-determining protein MreB n=3 Tax=Burkholderia multivorans TaxID=87883 RepID=A0A8E2RZ59_9BURK|nr:MULTISPECIES: rod shape-determining protein [Burkholderia]AJY15540.1 cell shape determining, MreB/Mrl family protein [Burkholderia multivorans ATCC BAA-247]AOJ95142.1 rod shape-determining protein MreB [Burkholderia multivorans]AVR18710.1 rod shape-determining protein [Burkholderia multivorans]EEE06596.1 cell shape determining protein, MreB/Mrl family [Burkholderia multivorans CGD2]EEE12217.1 cell shape determining protein, MreB/Mrl family [Burkholderia multivorans CGD2M]